MSIAITQDTNFKELSISFNTSDIDKLKNVVKGMRIVKIITKGGDLVLYQSVFKMIDVVIENEEMRPSQYDYIFTIKDMLNNELYYINMSFCDRMFFQVTSVLN